MLTMLAASRRTTKMRTKSNARKTHYWLNIENRRNFFIELAKDLGFDPYDAEQWHSVSYEQVIARQVTTAFEYH